MDVERFRAFCLSLDDVEERMPFGKFARRYADILAFYVAGHMFCLCDISDFTWIDFRVNPERLAELNDSGIPTVPPVNPVLRKWTGLELRPEVEDDTVMKLVKEAYDIVKG